MTDWGTAARKFVRGSHAGSLATHSLTQPGYPFVSVASFVPDEQARPVLLVSPLAEHSRNLETDPRASLMVHASAADAQAAARVTLVGDVERFEADEAFIERYLRYNPQAERLLQLGDFYFVRQNPKTIRFIGGFGAIRWVSPEDYRPPWHFDAGVEREMLEQLKREHAPLLQRLSSRHLGNSGAAICVGMDCDGLQFRNATPTRLDVALPATSFDALIAALDKEAAA